MMSALRRVEYNIIPGHSRQNKQPLRFNFLSSVPSVDADPNPLFYLNRNGNTIGCNKSFELLINRPRHRIIGKTVDAIFPDVVSTLVVRNFNVLIQFPGVRQFIASMPGHSVTLDSSLFWMTMSSSMVDMGEPVIFCTLTDISGIPFDRINSIKIKALADDDTERQPLISEEENNEAPSLETLIRSEKIKSKFLGWLGKLQAYLNAEGKTVLATMIRCFKNELNEEIFLRSERAFDDQHQRLYEQLKDMSSKITKNEMRLCALLQSGNSPTEIAKLTSRSTNCINVAFARIRSKLGLVNNHELKFLLSGLQDEGEYRNVRMMRINP